MIRRPPRSTLFPTRRSSDLGWRPMAARRCIAAAVAAARCARSDVRSGPPAEHERALDHLRSEEHTSELQSRLHLVCRLLLEKKKKEKKKSNRQFTKKK